MRTKTLLLSVALGAAGAASSWAQTPVYSVNAVGYVNLTVTNSFQMIANQLNAADSKISTFLPSPPGGTQIFAWNGLGFDTFEYIAGIGWFPNGDATLTPGGGVFLHNPNANPAANVTWGSGSTFLQPVTIIAPCLARFGVKFDW